MQLNTCLSSPPPEGPDDSVFRAISDPVRRALLDRLAVDGGQRLRELCTGLRMTRQSVTQHLALLERGGLLFVEWRGREKWHFVNAARLHSACERWLAKFAPATGASAAASPACAGADSAPRPESPQSSSS